MTNFFALLIRYNKNKNYFENKISFNMNSMILLDPKNLKNLSKFIKILIFLLFFFV